MACGIGYDGGVLRLNRATGMSFASLACAIAALMLVPASFAQINGAPASVSSIGFGGRPNSINGTAASVTSLGPRGFTPGFFNPNFPQNHTLFGPTHAVLGGRRHHHGQFVPWAGIPYALPYYGYYDDGEDTADVPPQDQYNGGPTIFDRRGPGTSARGAAGANAAGPGYGSGNAEQSETEASGTPEPEPAPVAAQPSTVLVFKDGHQLEVQNYAIVGNALYDLSEGRRHKIALADLDLTATAKANEDRGVDFEIPAGSGS